MRFAHVRRPSAAGTSRPATRSQLGETLIEVLVAIVLMGTGFSAIIGSLYTSARIAEVNQRNTKASVALQTIAESILQPARPNLSSTYIPCASVASPSSTDAYKDAMVGNPANLRGTWTWRTKMIRYAADPAIFVAPDLYKVSFTRSRNSCQNLSASNYNGRDAGLQEITIEVSNDANGTLPASQRVVQTLVFVMRDRQCPTANFSNADSGPC